MFGVTCLGAVVDHPRDDVVPFRGGVSLGDQHFRDVAACADTGYEIVLYVKNLFNTLGYDAAGAATAGYTGNPANPTFQQSSFDLTPPRTYGVEVHYKF